MKKEKKSKRISARGNASCTMSAALNRLNRNAIKVSLFLEFRNELIYQKKDIAHTNRTIQSYLVDQMGELSMRQHQDRQQVSFC